MKSACLLLSLATAVLAGDHSSADYAVPADDLATAGQRAFSADYGADQSLADSGSFGSSADYQARQGYTGQIFDPAGLSLAAAPASVSETATTQLSATVIHDDGTKAPLAASSVAWSPVSGPVQSIAAGVLTPGIVWANTAAKVRGDWNFITAFADLTVLDTNGDNYRNYAGDGIPDSWQVGYFGPDNPLGNAHADPDGDGQDNLFEYLADVLPNNPLSHFDIAISSAGPVRKDITFGPLAPGRSYRLDSSTDLTLWQPVPGTLPLGDVIQGVFQDIQAVEPRKFYRITISIP